MPQHFDFNCTSCWLASGSASLSLHMWMYWIIVFVLFKKLNFNFALLLLCPLAAHLESAIFVYFLCLVAECFVL